MNLLDSASIAIQLIITFLSAGNQPPGGKESHRPPNDSSHIRRPAPRKGSRRMLKKKTAVVAGGLALTLATAAIAFAYWTNSGSGTGSAASGTNGGITVKQTSTIAGLYPGGPAVPLAGNFDNLNTSNVYVHEVTATLGPVDGGSLPGPACSVDDFALTGSPASVNTVVDAGAEADRHAAGGHQPDQRRVLLQRRPARRHLPLPARRRLLRGLHQPEALPWPARPGLPRLRRHGGRCQRQPQRHHLLQLEGRHLG